MIRSARDGLAPYACKCGLLRRACEDPDIPITYVPEFNELHLRYQREGRQGSIIIRYCPSCGESAPESTRRLDYYEVTKDELERLIGIASAVVRRYLNADRLRARAPPRRQSCAEASL